MQKVHGKYEQSVYIERLWKVYRNYIESMQKVKTKHIGIIQKDFKYTESKQKVYRKYEQCTENIQEVYRNYTESMQKVYRKGGRAGDATKTPKNKKRKHVFFVFLVGLFCFFAWGRADGWRERRREMGGRWEEEES